MWAVLAYEWTFLSVFWSMLVFFAWLIFIWLAVMILYDNFAGTTTPGGQKPRGRFSSSSCLSWGC